MPKYTEEDFDYDLLPNIKDAELVINKAEVKTSAAGNKYVSIDWKIRDDLEQEYAGRHIFENIFQDKNHPGEYDRRKISKILSTVPEEERQNEFEDNDEVIQYLNGLYVMATIENKKADDYHDDDYNQIKYLSYKPTAHPAKKLNQIKKIQSNAIDVNDEDLPF